MREQQVVADPGGGHPADEGEFFLEGRGEARGVRRQEVGERAPLRDQGHQQTGVERAQLAEYGPAPGQVQRGQARVLQHAQAEQGLVQGRQGEAGVREVLDAEHEADH